MIELEVIVSEFAIDSGNRWGIKFAVGPIGTESVKVESNVLSPTLAGIAGRIPGIVPRNRLKGQSGNDAKIGAKNGIVEKSWRNEKRATHVMRSSERSHRSSTEHPWHPWHPWANPL